MFESEKPNWLLAPGRGMWPTMELNVATNLQRKFFYFPRAYGRLYGDTPFRRYLESTLTPGARFVEIGANVGFFALFAARLVGPEGRVCAFEPQPDICEALQRSARANAFTQIQTFQLALSDRDGELAFHRAWDGTASSLVAEVPGQEGRYQRTVTTKVTSLDKLTDEGVITATGIRLIKVDVEGEEVRTVRGMLRTLAAAGYPSIWCEVRGPHGSTRAPNTYPEVRDVLAPLGYMPFVWAEGSRRAVTDADVSGRTDILFERT